MPIYDYHRRVLCPDVWTSDEMHLRRRARAQIDQQLRTRFPNTSHVFLIGDLTGHYYDDGSAVDIMLLVPSISVSKYREEAKVVSGYNLKGTEHPVYFHVLPDTLKPQLLADKFGLMFDLVSNRWVGKREQGLTEFARPEAVLHYIRWQLYKLKNENEPYPYTWRILPIVLEHFTDDQRQWLIEELLEISARLKNNLIDVLEQYSDVTVWKLADQLTDLFDQEAEEEKIEEFVLDHHLPSPVVWAIYNMYRYIDVVETLKEIDEKIKKRTGAEWDQQGIQLHLTAETKTAGLGSAAYLEQKFIQLVDRIIQRNGGYHNAKDTVFQLMQMMLDNSRYLTARSQRRSIALRLQREFKN